MSEESRKFFALRTDTWREPDPVKRDYIKKAYNAYLKGKDTFYYKGELLKVPKISYSDIDEMNKKLENRELMKKTIKGWHS